MALRNDKVQDLKVFKTNIESFYQKILQEIGMRNCSQMILHL